MLKAIKQYAIGTRASKTINSCLSVAAGGSGRLANNFGVPFLDGADPRHTYLQDNQKFGLTPLEYKAFQNDSVLGRRPGQWTEYVDIPADSYYMELDVNGLPIRGNDGQYLYKYHATGELVKWSELPKAKDEKKFLWVFEKNKKRLAAPPVWYSSVKTAMLDYVDFIRRQGYFKEDGLLEFKDNMHSFFGKIESGRYEGKWWDVIYGMFSGVEANHWYVMSKVMPRFDRIMSDRTTVEELMNFEFKDEWEYRQFAESISAYADKARGGNYTILDTLSTEMRDKFYGKKTQLLFKETDDGVMIPNDITSIGVITKDYLRKLNVDQQILQLKATRGQEPGKITLNKWKALIQMKLIGDGGGIVLRFMNKLGRPWMLSSMMSLSKGIEGLLPLSILNSSMHLTDPSVKGTRLQGDWTSFMYKHGLQDGIGMVFHAGGLNPLPQTLGEITAMRVDAIKSSFEQGLFNISDTLMQDTYRITQLQTFFEGQFPGVRHLNDIDLQLQQLRKENPEDYSGMMVAAREWTEHAMRNLTTNTPIKASLARVHATKKAIYQPWADVYYTMWHFFAGWGWNKIVGAKEILTTGVGNLFKGRIGGMYLDELLSQNLPAREVHARMMKAYLENDALKQLFSRAYMSLLIGKYVDRTSESYEASKDESLTQDLQDMFKFAAFFNGEWAGLTSIPEYKTIAAGLGMFSEALSHNAGMGEAITAGSAKAATTYLNLLSRKLFVPKIFANFWGSVKDETDERELLQKFFGAIQDVTTGFLHYTADQTTVGEYELYTPAGPNAHLNDVLFMPNEFREKSFDLKDLNTHLTLFDSWENVKQYLYFRTPILKNYKIAALPEYNGFVDDFDNFSKSKGYQDILEDKVPEDMTDETYSFAYSLFNQRIVRDSNIENIKDNFYVSQEYVDKETGETRIAYTKKFQEDLLHGLMMNGLDTKQIAQFRVDLDNVRELYKLSKDEKNKRSDIHGRLATARANIARVIGQIESNSPGKGVDMMAYLLADEWYEGMFGKPPYVNKLDKELYQLKAKKVELEVAKKYMPILIGVDKRFITPQIIMHYAKKTDPQGFGRWVEQPNESNQNLLDLRLPGSDKGAKRLSEIFKAEYTMDLIAAKGDMDAYQVVNTLSTIFDLDKFKDENGDISDHYVGVLASELLSLHSYVNAMPMKESQKNHLKMGIMLYADQLIPHILKNPELMAIDDVRETISDYAHIWYKDVSEYDAIVKEQAEDNFHGKKLGTDKFSNSSYEKTGTKGQRKAFYSGYSYMRNRLYSSKGWDDYSRTGKIGNYYRSYSDFSKRGGYSQYRIYNWTPKQYERDYLRESQFLKAKENAIRAGVMVGRGQTSKRNFGKPIEKDGIGLQTRTGKSLQFYKREDIDKPVEYKTPWRKRWVRKGAGNDPISSSTWKRLSPKIKSPKG